MKKFGLGVLVGIFVPLVGILLFLKLGFMPVNADAQPGRLEKWLASMALNASIHRHAPHEKNPVPLNPSTLKQGQKLYKDNCSGCHGSPEGPSEFGRCLYPPAPQFVKRGPHDPEAEIFYRIAHGIRLTGMPAYADAHHPMLKNEEIWMIVHYLNELSRLAQPRPPENAL